MVLLLSLLPSGTSLNSYWWKKGWKKGSKHKDKENICLVKTLHREGCHSLAYYLLLSKKLFKYFARGLEREEILSQMTDPLVYVTLEFKAQPQNTYSMC